MRETARAFGASRLQSIFKVELPQALPTILSGIHRSAMIAVSMAVTGALVGAKGLGQELLASLTVLNVSLSLLCGISITFVAIMTNRLFLDLVARSEEKRLRRF
jgi:ABC-type proline/glycine betaine transport system permease subunit